jgi:hypothetical protein
MTEPLSQQERDEMTAALAKLGPKVDPKRKARKARQKQSLAAADGRSLRATGRTEQLNVRSSKRVKDLLAAHVEDGGLSLWVEEAILQKLRAEGVTVDE